MKTYALESPPSLAALVDEVKRGEEILLTDRDQPVARIVSPTGQPAEKSALARPRFGSLAGKIHMQPDFDEPLEEFQP